MSITVMKQALEALYWASDQTEPQQNDHCLCPICKGIDALRQAIAEAEKQEPVAYVHADELEELTHCNGMSLWAENALAHTDDSLSKQLLPSGYVAIYTTPLKPLTREVIDRAFYGRVDFVRQVEAAHNIKGEE